MVHPTGQSQKKLHRKRELNVIYFVDSDKTRTFKFPLNKVKLFAGVLTLVGVWALCSFWVLVQMVRSEEQAHQRIVDYQNVIFDFQTRYNNVYESAYPKGDQLIGSRSEEDEQLEESAEINDEPETADNSDSMALAAKDGSSAAGEKLDKEGDTSADEPTVDVPKPTVAIEGNRFSKSGDNLSISFSIRNTISPRKALGYMWAVAEYKSDNGEVLYVGYPKNINVNRKGIATDTSSATRYNIRRFKPVKVTFASPQGVPGKFQSVKIMIMDREGNRQTNNLPVDIDVGFSKTASPSVPADVPAAANKSAEESDKGESQPEAKTEQTITVSEDELDSASDDAASKTSTSP